MSLQRGQSGVTLLELLLVIAIAFSLIMLGSRFYADYQFRQYEDQLRQKVSQLFLATRYFYQANCRQHNGGEGLLDPSPSGNPTLSDPYPINIETDLVANQFLTGWQPSNPLVEETEEDSGYVVQFNRVDDGKMNVTACMNNKVNDTCDAKTTTQPKLLSGTHQVVRWTAQVAVKLANSDEIKAKALLKVMGADCLSSLAGNFVTSCEESAGEGPYLVWERAPTTGLGLTHSSSWVFEPMLKNFNMQYTNDGMAGLSHIYWNNSDYYLCGE